MIREITAAETIAVRWPILRPGFPRETAVFPGDDDPNTRHFGAFDASGALVGVTSIYRAPLPERPEEPGAWQLRGMATLDAVRGSGHGRDLVIACEQAVVATGGAFLWCNARIVAAPFYAKRGWQILGEEFDIPTVGPHYRMWKKL
jgi:GNAT superfamily N-acetyltransferase